jgi:heat shock protein HtpX
MTTTKQSTLGATLRTTILMASLGGLLVVIGALIGGPQTALLFLGIALLINFFSYFFSDKMALAMSRAKPISESEAPRLYQMVRELTTRADLPMPRLYMIRAATPSIRPSRSPAAS